MDQYIHSADYWTLVQMLLTPITPQIRHQILIRLIEMNKHLMNDFNVLQTPNDKTPKSYRSRINNNVLDDILDGIAPQEDELDMKLAKISKLQKKIIADKRRKRLQKRV